MWMSLVLFARRPQRQLGGLASRGTCVYACMRGTKNNVNTNTNINIKIKSNSNNNNNNNSSNSNSDSNSNMCVYMFGECWGELIHPRRYRLDFRVPGICGTVTPC